MSKEVVQLVLRKRDPLVIGEDVFPPANDHILSEYELNLAFKELNETEEKRKSCLPELRKKLLGEKIKYRTDDEYLLRYLRFRKYDCNKAFKSIQQFYSKRQSYPDVFSMPSNLESVLDTGYISWMPYRDQDGCIVFNLDLSKWDPSVPLRDILPTLMAVSDIVSMDPHSQINGVKGVWNVEGIRAAHLPDILRYCLFLLSLVQDCYPWRVKNIVIINCSELVVWIYKKLRFAVTKKIYDRVIILGCDYHTELHKLIKPAVLRKEYGGELNGYVQFSKENVLDNLSYLKYEQSFVLNKDF